MKRYFVIALILIVCLSAYAAWPLAVVYQLADAAETRNVAAISERIDAARLRQSLGLQIVEAYVKLTGRTRLGRINTIVAATAGASLADPIIAQIMNSEALVNMLASGTLPNEPPRPVALPGPLSKAGSGSIWNLVRNSEFGIGNFYISLPSTAPQRDRFRLQFRITQWRWKLTSITLPERVKFHLAHELAKLIEQASAPARG